jgi:hypothetical protein
MIKSSLFGETKMKLSAPAEQVSVVGKLNFLPEMSSNPVSHFALVP